MSKMKEIYESIDFKKVDGSIKEQFDSIKSETDNFSDADLMGVYQENFDSLVEIVKAKHPEAMKGGEKAAPKEKADKPAKEKKASKKKAKKEKPAKAKKEEITFKGKPLSEVDCDELLKDYRERREQAKKSAKKTRTKSIFEKVAERVEAVAEAAIKSIPKQDIADNPKVVIDRVEKIAEATERYLKEFKGIMGDEYDSEEVKSVVNELEAIAIKLRDKYMKK